MAEASQYTFELTELAEGLVKQQGLREGRWLLAFEFNLTVGMFGTAPNEPTASRPGAMVQIAKIQLIRKDDAPLEMPGLVDAAQVNPSRKDSG